MERKKEVRVEIITACIGMALFIALYGIKVLNPTYVGFISLNDDLKQHYIGWCYYRNSVWHFPIGLMDGIVYPHLSSIIYTDSIPVLAVLFKVIAPVLPADFQYFGLWGLISSGLIGLFAGKILKIYLHSSILVCIASLFFVLSPVYYRRMFGHTALASLWLLLWAMYLFICKINGMKKSVNKECIAWAMLCVLCSSVHIYYIPICGICLAGYCMFDFLRTKKIWNSILYFVSYCFSGLGTLGLLGAFGISGISFSGGPLGDASANLTSFVNGGGWSRFFQEMPTYVAYGNEGFAYLGVGMLILLCFTVGCQIYSRKESYVSADKHVTIVVWVVMAVALFIALGPTAHAGRFVLYSMELPKWIKSIWSTFYACGRFIWIPMFVIYIYSCTNRWISNKKYYAVVLIICICLQIFDLSEKYISIHEVYMAERTWENEFEENVLSVLENDITGYQHIMIVSRELLYDNEAVSAIGRFAVDNHLTTNYYRVGRYSRDVAYEEAVQALEKGFDKDTMYIFSMDDFDNGMTEELYYYNIGKKYIIGVVED